MQDTSESPVREIIRTLTEYYRLPQPGRTRTPLWVANEQARYPLYDLAAPGLYRNDFQATIASVLPATADSSVWVIRTLFATADSGGMNIQPLGFQRIYARRAAPGSGGAPHGWQLSGAFGELTRGWETREVGGITYRFARDYPFRVERARAGDRFVDSAAALVGVTRPERIDYYLTPSWEACEQLTGLDWSLNRVVFAGRAFPEERVVCSGDPSMGEAYWHELAHVVLAPLAPTERMHRMVSEGAATWLGGGGKGSVEMYYRLLREYQIAHPDATFTSLLKSFDFDAQQAWYATGAVLVGAVLRRGGKPALRQLFAVGPTNDELLAELPRLLGVRRDGLDVWWRQEAERAATRAFPARSSGQDTGGLLGRFAVAPASTDTATAAAVYWGRPLARVLTRVDVLFQSPDAELIAAIRANIREAYLASLGTIDSVRLEVAEGRGEPGDLPVIYLAIKTVNEYGCTGMGIDHAVTRSGDTLRLRLHGVTAPKLACSLAMAPARAVRRLDVSPGLYTLMVEYRERADQFRLHITDSSIAFTAEQSAFVLADERLRWRHPRNSFALNCPSVAEPRTICGDVQRWLVRQRGITRIAFPRGGINPFWPDTASDLDKQPSVFRYDGPRSLAPVRRCFAAIQEEVRMAVGVSLTLKTWTGGQMEAWSTRSNHEQHIEKPEIVTAGVGCRGDPR